MIGGLLIAGGGLAWIWARYQQKPTPVGDALDRYQKFQKQNRDWESKMAAQEYPHATASQIQQQIQKNDRQLAEQNRIGQGLPPAPGSNGGATIKVTPAPKAAGALARAGRPIDLMPVPNSISQGFNKSTPALNNTPSAQTSNNCFKWISKDGTTQTWVPIPEAAKIGPLTPEGPNESYAKRQIRTFASHYPARRMQYGEGHWAPGQWDWKVIADYVQHSKSFDTKSFKGRQQASLHYQQRKTAWESEHGQNQPNDPYAGL